VGRAKQFSWRNIRAVALIKENLESLEIRKGARVLKSDALQALNEIAEAPAPESARIGILFLDPPYADGEQYKNVLSFLGNASLLAENAVVIAEHQSKLDLPESFGKLERVRVLRQGDATLTFYRFRPPVCRRAPTLQSKPWFRSVHLSSRSLNGPEEAGASASLRYNWEFMGKRFQVNRYDLLGQAELYPPQILLPTRWSRNSDIAWDSFHQISQQHPGIFRAHETDRRGAARLRPARLPR
jgi:hypothetical protein